MRGTNHHKAGRYGSTNHRGHEHGSVARDTVMLRPFLTPVAKPCRAGSPPGGKA